MTQNIKNFIEEGEKELIEFISDLQKTYPLQHITPHPQYELDIRNKAKSIQISLIKMIVDVVKDMRLKNENAIDKLEEVDERARITNLLNENLQIGYQLALQDISSKLKELTDGK